MNRYPTRTASLQPSKATPTWRGRPRAAAFQAFLVAVLVLPTAPQAADARTDPGTVVRETTEELLSRVDEGRDQLTQDKTKLHDLVGDVVLPVVDFDYVARLVLGKYWRRAAPEQRERFTEQFRTLLIRSYAAHLLDSQNVKIDYGKTQHRDDDQAVVTTMVNVGSGEPVDVKYVMHRRDGKWQVYDVIIAGVSVVLNFRNQFSQEIGRKGLNGFLEQLASKNELAVEETFGGKGH